MEALTLKRHNYTQNYIITKTTNTLAPRPLIFKFPQKVLKFRDI